MFVEITNVQNSILFLGTARETLSNLIEQTELEEKESLKNHHKRKNIIMINRAAVSFWGTAVYFIYSSNF